MRDINPTISITLNISGVNNIAQSRLLDWKKKKIQLYAVYKKHSLDLMVQVMQAATIR